MDKLKAIVVGAFPRFEQKIDKRLSPFLDYRIIRTQGKEKLTNEFYAEARVIVVLKDYVSRIHAEAARSVGRTRRIPVIECKSENYVKDELLRHKLLEEEKTCKDGNGNPSQVSQVAVPRPESSETVVGIDPNELWKNYGTRMKEVVEIVLEPGKHYHENDILDFMSKEVGLPREDIKLLLSELAGRGLILQTGENAWKRPGDELPGLEAEPEKPVEVKAKQPYWREMIIGKMRGLAPGPYSSRYALALQLLKYKDFACKDGTRPSKTYCMRMVQWGIEAGYVEEKDDAIHILIDPSVKLTPDPDYKEPRRKKSVREKKEAKEKEPIRGLPTTYVSLASLKTEGPKPKVEAPPVDKSTLDDKAKRSALGTINVALLSGQIRILKGLMQMAHWNESASREMQSRFLKLGFPPRTVVPMELFTNDEWDALAWADISKLPMSVVVPTWRVNYEDEKLTCIDCHQAFIFTRQQKVHFFNLFGEVTSPNRCKFCQKVYKARGGSSPDDDADRILRRHGG